MQRQRLRAGVLAAQCDLDRVPLRFVPAAPDLHGDGEVRGGADRADDALHQAHVLEATRPPVVADDLLHRAAEVDVHKVGLEQLGDHAGCLGHDLGVGAVDLDADRALDRLEPHLGEHALDTE